MRILITGITGFVGGHLTEVLHAEGGHTFAGITRHGTWGPVWSHLVSVATLHAVDLLDASALSRIVQQVSPEWVFHLAGYANPRKSTTEPDLCHRVNVEGTRTLFEALRQAKLTPRVLFASTGMVYGDPEQSDHPLDESTPFRPATPYAASKIAAEELCVQAGRDHGLDVMRVRLFNQIGPRQSTDYFSARFAKQIVEVERGHRTAIETGDLSASRDLTDVRDMVRAFRLLLERGQAGEVYNAGQGTTWRIRDVLKQMMDLAGVAVPVTETIPAGSQPETAIIRADASKLRRITGWEPRYDLRQTLTDVLNYWRQVS